MIPTTITLQEPLTLRPVEEAQRKFDLELEESDKPPCDYMVIPSGGTKLERVAEDVIECARATGMTILLVFCGKGIFCLPGDDKEAVIEAYRSL